MIVLSMVRRTRVLQTIAFCIVLVVSALPLFVAEAQIPGDVGTQLNAAARGAGTETQGAPLEVIVARIINATFSLIGVVLVSFVVWAGWLWMTAAGESEKIEQAQKILRNAVIGLIIVLSAYGISRFVITALIRATANVR